MKLKRKYKLLILLLAIFILSVNGYSQAEIHVQMGEQLFPTPKEISPVIRDGTMEIGIYPKGTFELRDPLGRRIVHRQKEKDIVEIPRAEYAEESFSEDEPFTSRIYIESPVEGYYEIKIFHVTDKDYIFYVYVGNHNGDCEDEVNLDNIPFQKGHPQIYDIQFDKKNWKVKVKRR